LIQKFLLLLSTLQDHAASIAKIIAEDVSDTFIAPIPAEQTHSLTHLRDQQRLARSSGGAEDSSGSDSPLCASSPAQNDIDVSATPLPPPLVSSTSSNEILAHIQALPDSELPPMDKGVG